MKRSKIQSICYLCILFLTYLYTVYYPINETFLIIINIVLVVRTFINILNAIIEKSNTWKKVLFCIFELFIINKFYIPRLFELYLGFPKSYFDIALAIIFICFTLVMLFRYHFEKDSKTQVVEENEKQIDLELEDSLKKKQTNLNNNFLLSNKKFFLFVIITIIFSILTYFYIIKFDFWSDSENTKIGYIEEDNEYDAVFKLLSLWEKNSIIKQWAKPLLQAQEEWFDEEQVDLSLRRENISNNNTKNEAEENKSFNDVIKLHETAIINYAHILIFYIIVIIAVIGIIWLILFSIIVFTNKGGKNFNTIDLNKINSTKVFFVSLYIFILTGYFAANENLSWDRFSEYFLANDSIIIVISILILYIVMLFFVWIVFYEFYIYKTEINNNSKKIARDLMVMCKDIIESTIDLIKFLSTDLFGSVVFLLKEPLDNDDSKEEDINPVCEQIDDKTE